jgi:opine dehydrogenase
MLIFPQPVAALTSSRSAAGAGCLSTGIVGTSNTGRALAAYLSSQGHSVHLLARTENKLRFLGKRSIIKAEGKIEGSFPVASASCSSSEFCNYSEVIFVGTITTAYAEIAQKLAPHLTEKHNIILFSSKLGGALIFEEALKAVGCKIPNIIETDALFAARIKEEDDSIWIRGFKQWTLFSSATKTKTQKNAGILKQFFPNLSPAVNIIQRGLTDFGAVAHVPIALSNMNLISSKTPFNFYYNGMTEETISLLEAVESEFRNLALAYGSELIAMKDLLNRYYGCDNTSLFSAMTTVPNYRHSQGPSSLQHRFLHEDICSTLAPARQLAELAGVKTPVIDSLVNIASVITKRDFEAESRSLRNLGLEGMSFEQVFDYVNG